MSESLNAATRQPTGSRRDMRMRSGDRAPLTIAWRALLRFHASTVTIDGRAVLIAGPAGAGKSTLAAALTALAARSLSNDLVWPRLVAGREDAL